MYKRRFSRRRQYRTKRRIRRRFRKSTGYNKKGQRLYFFKRNVDLPPVVLGTAAETAFAQAFRLGDLPGSSEFTALYDSYKINAVKLRFFPSMTESISTSTMNAPQGETRIITVIDRNDATPLNFDGLRQYQNAKVVRINKQFSRFIYKPQILDTSGYSVSPWMSTAFPSIFWYGLKFAAEATGQATGTYRYHIEATYYLSFKTVK